MRVPIALVAGVFVVLVGLVLGWPPLTVLAAGAAGAVLTQVARLLWRHWKPVIVLRVDRSGLVSGFPRAYRDHLASSVRFVDQKGLRTTGFANPELDDVYVDVSVTYLVPHQADAGIVTTELAGATRRRSIDEFLDQPEATLLAVVGAPGSGKTTLLRHTVRAISQNPNRRRPVPVLLYLRQHVDAIVEDKSVLLPELVRDTLGELAEREPTGWFGDRLVAGQCVILLDGLDEVAGQEQRLLIADWVERQANQYRGNDFVVTSRLDGILNAPLTGAKVLQTRQFTPKQVRRFVLQWYGAVERLSTGGSEEEVAARALEAGEDLLDKLRGAPGLADFTANPLLLTMIANVHRFRGALPGSRADLYREICQVMLWRRQEAKKLPVGLAGEKKEQMLRALAFRMMTAGVTELRREEVLAGFTPALRKLSTPLTAEDMLADASSNGLLVEREAGRYAFAHKTFQEYLAAAHIREHKLVDELVYRVDDAYWEETTLLYTAEADADDIIQACLASGSANALSLAYKCLEQGDALALEPDLRQELANLLDTQRFGQATAQQRRATATILANQYVTGWSHPRQGVRIADKAVPAALYRLFELEVGITTDTTDDLNGICSGMSGSHARDFCLWFNSLLGTDQTYRLPGSREMAEHPVASLLVWTFDQTIGVWSHHGQAHLVTENDLWEVLVRDLDTPAVFLMMLLEVYAAASNPQATWDSVRLTARLHTALMGQKQILQDSFAALVGIELYSEAEVLHPLLGDPAIGFVDLWRSTGNVFAPVVRKFALDSGLTELRQDNVSARGFSKAWIDQTGFPGWTGWDAPPEALGELLGSVLDQLGHHGADLWRTRAIAVLRDLLPVLTSDKPRVYSLQAKQARVACLFLSAVLRGGKEDLATRLIDIAAGITLVERRFSGGVRADETIVLVADWSAGEG
ncbi:NACHT domain-containing protein [Actinokineospora inagensis]|uniref:NACHT domain-containing protein n=1 Tax=Actinokineospora inagensis TaxID=103730 RepID=UPI00042649D1|nr:NACHT domain-containing protein [Actinokineospora inagensis]